MSPDTSTENDLHGEFEQETRHENEMPGANPANPSDCPSSPLPSHLPPARR